MDWFPLYNSLRVAAIACTAVFFLGIFSAYYIAKLPRAIKGMLDGLDAMLSIIQMPPGIPVATVGVNAAQNAAILAVEMMALSDEALAQRLADYKSGLKEKIEKANKELAEIKYDYKV